MKTMIRFLVILKQYLRWFNFLNKALRDVPIKIIFFTKIHLILFLLLMLEMKKFDAHLCQEFEQNPKMTISDFTGLRISLQSGKIPFAMGRHIRLANQIWVTIDIDYAEDREYEWPDFTYIEILLCAL